MLTVALGGELNVLKFKMNSSFFKQDALLDKKNM